MLKPGFIKTELFAWLDTWKHENAYLGVWVNLSFRNPFIWRWLWMIRSSSTVNIISMMYFFGFIWTGLIDLKKSDIRQSAQASNIVFWSYHDLLRWWRWCSDAGSSASDRSSADRWCYQSPSEGYPAIDGETKQSKNEIIYFTCMM